MVEPQYDTEDMFNFYENEARRKKKGGPSYHNTAQAPLWDDWETKEEKPKKKVVAPKASAKPRSRKPKPTVNIVDGVRIIDID